MACFYLTGQLESILRKFQLAVVVLVVSKAHVFNLTGQLDSKPPKFHTLAATDQRQRWQHICVIYMSPFMPCVLGLACWPCLGPWQLKFGDY